MKKIVLFIILFFSMFCHTQAKRWIKLGSKDLHTDSIYFQAPIAIGDSVANPVWVDSLTYVGDTLFLATDRGIFKIFQSSDAINGSFSEGQLPYASSDNVFGGSDNLQANPESYTLPILKIHNGNYNEGLIIIGNSEDTLLHISRARTPYFSSSRPLTLRLQVGFDYLTRMYNNDQLKFKIDSSGSITDIKNIYMGESNEINFNSDSVYIRERRDGKGIKINVYDGALLLHGSSFQFTGASPTSEDGYNIDQNTSIDKDVSNNLVLRDVVTGQKTLAELAQPGDSTYRVSTADTTKTDVIQSKSGDVIMLGDSLQDQDGNKIRGFANVDKFYFGIALSDSLTEITTSNGDGFNLPYDCTIDSVFIRVNTAPTGSALSVDIKKNTTSIFSTLITIDSGEKTSATAATPYVLSTTTALRSDDFQAIVNSAGATFGGAGLKVYIYATKN